MTIAPVGANFHEVLHSVLNNALRARISFDIWWVQEGQPNRAKYLDAMNNYADFFRFDALAHLTAMVVGLYRLYDRRLDVRSLNSLLAAASNAPGISVAARTNAKTLFDLADALYPKIKILRNKAFGHTDLALSYDDAFAAAGVTPNELRGLLDAALQVVNVFEAELGMVVSEFYEYPELELRGLLDSLPH